MNRFALITLIFSAIVICTSCGKNKEESEEKYESKIIEGLTLENYPRVDGSTSTEPLNALIACKLLGISYEWAYSDTRSWGIEPILQKKNTGIFQNRIKSSQTHESFINLIDKKTSLILSARTMSPDEKNYAKAAGVTLIETPIALDAFVFVINPDNPVESLTIEQIEDIYTGKITNWKEVGGNDSEINPYVRNANSGSQETMESLVMKDLPIMEFPIAQERVVHSMVGVIDVLIRDINSICYTFFYYKEQILRDLLTKTIAIEGIYPNKNTIFHISYPYVSEVYAVIRSDLDESSMAYQVYEWLQTAEGKYVINESGYLPAD